MQKFVILYNRLFSFTFLLFFTINCLGFPKYQFTAYTVNDGLTHNYITFIHQDKDGFIWIGTRSGLNMFDGYTFKKFTPSYKNEHAVARSEITDITEDNEGRIYISSLGEGVCFYDKMRESFTRVNIELIRNIDVTSILIEENNLWIAHHLGIDIINIDTWQAISDRTILSAFKNIKVNKLLHASNNNVLIGTEHNGLYIYNTKTKTLCQYLNSIDIEIYGICESSPGIYWIGTMNNGLYKFDLTTHILKTYKASPKQECSIAHNKTYGIFIDNKKNIWIGTENGINILNTESGECFEQIYFDPKASNSLSDNKVLYIYQDRYGVMWIGTRMGLNKLDYNKIIHYSHNPQKNSLHHNNVHCFKEDKNGFVWIGTSRGIDRFNPLTEQFTHFKIFRDDPNSEIPILCVEIDNENNLWLGTWRYGLNYYNPLTKKLLSFSKDILKKGIFKSEQVFALQRDKNDNLWIGTWGEGIAFFDKKNSELTYYRNNPADSFSISNNYICQLLIDDENRLWIGNQNGINLLEDKKEGKFKRFILNKDDSAHLGANFVTDMCKSYDTILWAATLNGLYKLNTITENIRPYFKENGLASNKILSVTIDNNKNLWAGTNKGLSKITLNNLTDSAQVFNYNKEDGLQGEDFLGRSILKTSKELMFIGGRNGFNVFKLNAEKNVNIVPPDIFFTQLDIHNNTIEIGDTINNEVILKKSFSQIDEIKLSKKIILSQYTFQRSILRTPIEIFTSIN